MENSLQGLSKIARDETTPSVETSTKRLWADLPLEMLAHICIRLSLIDLLSFRGTCKDWRTASTTTRHDSVPQNRPWILLYEKENAGTQIILCNDQASKKYKIDIPELNGANCLASHKGWILLHYNCGSLIFFSPFSRAKIELPKFPSSEIFDRVAVLSAPPTSEKCIICVINRQNQFVLDLHVLRRGDENWKKIEYPCSLHKFGMMVAGGIYSHREGSFYFLDTRKDLLTYSDRDEKWKSYTIVEVLMGKEKVDPLPFYYTNNLFQHNAAVRKLAELDDEESVSTCGTVIPGPTGGRGNTLILNEVDISLGTFSENRSHLKGIWVEPRFCQISSSQSWSL